MNAKQIAAQITQSLQADGFFATMSASYVQARIIGILKSALATAPPEQAALEQPDQYDKLQPPTTTTIMPDQPEAYPGQAFFHKHNANIKRAEERADQPQPASDGALDVQEKFTRALVNNNTLEQLLLCNWTKDAAHNPIHGLNIKGLINSLVDLLGAALASHDQATLPAKLTLADITTALDYASEGRDWRGVKPDLLGNQLNRILARLADEVPIIHGQAELASHDQKVRAEATLAEHKSHVDFENELYATLVDPVAEGSIKEAEMRKQLLEQAKWYRQRVYDLTDFTALLKAAQQGMEIWAAKPGNQKWWKRIDGTPIPNDLLVNVVQAIRGFGAPTTDNGKAAPAASKPEAAAKRAKP